MKKWRHLRMTYNSNLDGFEIFPASRVNLDWLFAKYPKIKKGRSDNPSMLIVEVRPKEVLSQVEEEILTYLEDNGWEGYAYVPNWQSQAFKRLEEN